MIKLTEDIFKPFDIYDNDLYKSDGLLKSLTTFAVLSYQDKEKVKKEIDSLVDLVEDYEWFSESNSLVDTQGFFFRDKKSGHAVICFRGTKGKVDLLTDVLVKPRGMLTYDSTKYYKTYFVHSGFQKALELVWPKLENFLSKCNNQVFICGHSLGGALATIVGARLVLSEHKNKFGGLVTIGSPRVLTSKAAKAVQKEMKEHKSNPQKIRFNKH